MQLDPLNDALVKIYNAEQAGKFNVELTPASKLLGNVLNIMQTSGYVGEIERVETDAAMPSWWNCVEPLTAAARSSPATASVAKNTRSGKLDTFLPETLVFSS